MWKARQISLGQIVSGSSKGPKGGGPKLRAAKSTFREFTEKTTIHGLHFLGERGRSPSERVLWLSVFVLAVYGATAQIFNLWEKWQETPVIVSFSDQATPVWQIPFPAVTLCPSTKVRREFLNFSTAFANLDSNTTYSESDYHYFKSVLQTCTRYILRYYNETRPEELQNQTFVDSPKDLVDTLISIAPSFDEIFVHCVWRNKDTTNCSSLFQRIITDEGLCYTFNMMNQRDIYRREAWANGLTNSSWSLQEGYADHYDEDAYPYRVIGSGVNGGVQIFLDPDENDFVVECVGMFQGYKIYFHAPEEPPSVNNFYTVPYGAHTVVNINPRIVITSEGIRRYTPSKRQCYFPHERYLRYFKTYSEKNCYQECLTNITFSECGCVKYSYPRHKDIPVCGIGKLLCVIGSTTKYVHFKNSSFCDCKPTCTSITYDAFLSQTSSIHKRELGLYTGISIIFREDEFVTSKRSELYGLSDFLANCGGILGLFIGLSAVSVIEICYFCSIRFMRNIDTKKLQKIEEDP